MPENPTYLKNDEVFGSPNGEGYLDDSDVFTPTPQQDRSTLGDIGSNIVRGVGDTAELAGHALKTAGAETAGDWLIDKGTDVQESSLATPDKAEMEGEGFVKRGIMGGVRSIVPSATAAGAGFAAGAAAGSVVPGVGNIVGGLVGAGLGSLGLFGAGVYGKEKQNALDSNLDEKSAHDHALKQALVEGGIEAIATPIQLMIGGIGKTVTQPIKQTVKELLKTPAKQLFKNYAKTMGIETSTEMLQSGLGNELAKQYGLEEGATSEAVIESIIPAMTMSLMFGMASHGYNANQQKKMRNALINGEADARERANVANTVWNAIGKEDPELAEQWRVYAQDAITNYQPIDIDEHFSEFAAHQKGKEIKPSGDGEDNGGVVTKATKGEFTEAPYTSDLEYDFIDQASAAQDYEDTRFRQKKFEGLQAEAEAKEWNDQQEAAQAYNQQRNQPQPEPDPLNQEIDSQVKEYEPEVPVDRTPYLSGNDLMEEWINDEIGRNIEETAKKIDNQPRQLPPGQGFDLVEPSNLQHDGYISDKDAEEFSKKVSAQLKNKQWRAALAKIDSEKQKAEKVLKETPPELKKQAEKEAKAIIDQDPVYQHMAEAKNRGGINLASFKADYDSTSVSQIQKRYPGIFSTFGQVNADEFASEMGYTNLSDMVDQFSHAKTKKELQAKLVSELSDQWQDNEAQGNEMLLRYEAAGTAGPEYKSPTASYPAAEQDIEIMVQRLQQDPEAFSDEDINHWSHSPAQIKRLAEARSNGQRAKESLQERQKSKEKSTIPTQQTGTREPGIQPETDGQPQQIKSEVRQDQANINETKQDTQAQDDTVLPQDAGTREAEGQKGQDLSEGRAEPVQVEGKKKEPKKTIEDKLTEKLVTRANKSPEEKKSVIDQLKEQIEASENNLRVRKDANDTDSKYVLLNKESLARAKKILAIIEEKPQKADVPSVQTVTPPLRGEGSSPESFVKSPDRSKVETGATTGLLKVKKGEDIRSVAKQYYKDTLRNIKTSHPEIGEISFTRRGMNKTISSSADTKKLLTLPLLPELIKNGSLVDKQAPSSSKKDFVKWYYRIANEVEIDGEEHSINILIEEKTNGAIHYNMRLSEIKKGSLGSISVDTKTNSADTAVTDASPSPNTITPKDSEGKLDLERVRRAYYGTSNSPRTAAELEQQNLDNFIKDLKETAVKEVPGISEEQLDKQLSNIRTMYVTKRERALAVRENTVSSHVAGRSKFNSKQAAKRNSALDRAESRFSRWLEGTRDAFFGEVGVTEARRLKAQKKEEARQRIEKEIPKRQQEMFDSIEVGDRIDIGGNSPIEVVKKNKVTVVTNLGSKYRKEDIAKVIKKEKTEQPKSAIQKHTDFFERMDKGEVTLEEFKAGWEEVKKDKESLTEELGKLTKKKIFNLFPGMEYRYKNDKKDFIVRAAAEEFLKGYNLSGTISFMFGEKNAMENAIGKNVQATTEENLKEHAEAQRKREESIKERKEKVKSALKDPKTLEDYIIYFRSQMAEGKKFKEIYDSITHEQRVAYDSLAAEKSREERKGQREKDKTRVTASPVKMTGDIHETQHTKTGEDLFVVKPTERVERDVYKHWNATAKRMGGWYSKFRGRGAIPGFQFKTRENAEAFLDFLGGNVESVKESIQKKQDVFKDNREQTAVERLTAMAERLEERAQESLGQDRKVNTARRARMAASAEAAAESDIALAKTMRNIAGAIESGKAKMLDQVRQKVQVEELRRFVSEAKYTELKKKYPEYRDWERNRHEPPTSETIDYAEFPSYTASRSDLARLGRQLLDIRGGKALGRDLLKVADDVTDTYKKFAKDNLNKVATFRYKDGGIASFTKKRDATRAIEGSGYNGKAIVLTIKPKEHLIILSPQAAQENGVWEGDGDKRITLSRGFAEEILNKRSDALSIPHYYDIVSERLKRLSGMGIETAPEYRAALREFISLKEEAKAPDKIKELERKMIGRANDGLDFFPTNESTIDTMIDAAELKEGMNVLEPSAGMGHIADKIRKADIEPDVVEMSGNRQELLELKGYKLVGRDFLEIKERGFTYGDTFKAPDGKVGVMRGLGGLGSDRVRLVDDNGEAIGYYNRSELEEIKKNGSDSGYDRILMNPPFSKQRDIDHVKHAYDLLKPGGRIVAVMSEGSFFRSNKKATAFREWMDELGATSERLPEGSFNDPNLPVNTGVNARMVIIDKPEAKYSKSTTPSTLANLESELQSKLGSLLDRQIKSGEVVIIDNQEDIPVHLRDKTLEPGKVISAVTAPSGTVYLVRDGIAKGEAWNTYLHEKAVHANQLGLKKGVYSFLESEVPKWKNRKGKSGAVIREAIKAVPADTATENINAEILAYAIQNHPEVGFVRKAIARVKKFLVDKFGERFVKLLNTSDLRAIAEMSVKGKPVTGGGEAKYSVAKSPTEFIQNQIQDFSGNEHIKKKLADSTFLEKIFSSFEYTSRKAPAAHRVLQVQYDRMSNKYKLENEIFGNLKGGIGFVDELAKAKKNDKSSYKKANDYLLKVDKTGKGFGLDLHSGYRVATPEGDFLGYADTEIKAIGLAREHANLYNKTHPDTKRTNRDYTKDEGQWWDVTGKNGEVISTHTDEQKAVSAMIEAEQASLLMPKKAKDLIKSFREMTNRSFDKMIADLRNIVEEAKKADLDEPTVSTIDESKRWAVFKGREKVATFPTREQAKLAAGKGYRIKEQADEEIRKVMNLSEVIAQMADLRGTYFPRQRNKGAVILRAEKDGDKILKKYDFHLVDDKYVDISTGKEFNRPVLSFLKGASNAGLSYIPGSLANEAKKLDEKGYKLSIEKDTSVPESVFDAVKLASSIDSILQEAQKSTEKKEANKTAAREINKILTAGVADIFKQRGYMSSRLKRSSDYWRGFEEDMLLAGTQYGRGIASGLAKRDAAKKMLLALTGKDKSFQEWKTENHGGKYEDYLEFVKERRLNPTKQPALYEETLGFIKEVLRNEERVDRVLGTLQGIAVVKFLGFRVSSAAVNMTNMVQAVPATISSYSGKSITSAFGAIKNAAVQYGRFRTGKNIDADARSIFLEIQNNGWDEAQFNKESVEVLQSKFGRGWNQFAEWSMYMFSAAERANRATTIYAAYQEIISNTNLSRKEALERAKAASDDAHGVYGKATRPIWTRGAWNPLRLPFTFAKFSQNYVNNMYRMGVQGDHKQAAYMLLSPAVLAGTGATLATPVLAAMAKALGVGGEDPEEEFYQWAEDTFGTDRIARHGLAGLAGINLKGSIQMNNPMPTKLSELAGAPGAIFTDTKRGIEHILKGEVMKGGEALLPTAIGSTIKATREATEGLSTGSYSPVYYGNEPIKATNLDAALRFLSFNPSRISGIREKQWREKVVAKKFQERRAEINSMIRRHYIYGKGDSAHIFKEISRYNNMVKDLGRRDISLINPRKQIRLIVRQARRASKIERYRNEKAG